jgi:hypothetical protein
MSTRTIDHNIKERILDLWFGGAGGAEIKQRIRTLSRQNIEYVIAQARNRGDQRAVRRHQNKPHPNQEKSPPHEYTREGRAILNTPVFSAELGIRRVTRMVPNHTFAGQGTSPLYVPISLPRLSFLEPQP